MQKSHWIRVRKLYFFWSYKTRCFSAVDLLNDFTPGLTTGWWRGASSAEKANKCKPHDRSSTEKLHKSYLFIFHWLKFHTAKLDLNKYKSYQRRNEWGGKARNTPIVSFCPHGKKEPEEDNSEILYACWCVGRQVVIKQDEINVP